MKQATTLSHIFPGLAKAPGTAADRHNSEPKKPACGQSLHLCLPVAAVALAMLELRVFWDLYVAEKRNGDF